MLGLMIGSTMRLLRWVKANLQEQVLAAEVEIGSSNDNDGTEEENVKAL